MSLFLDFLTDEDGDTYEYGTCYQDADDGSETGCGMEYAYYADQERLDRWHNAVGLVTTKHGFTSAQRDQLDHGHETCHKTERRNA